MSSTYNPGVHRFSVFIVCWTVFLFVAGALVTSKDAALSVTDWPKSHGTWIPPLATLQGSDLFEFSHRLVAGVLGILTLALAALLWVKEKRPWLRWLGLIAVLGVAVQADFGGAAVMRALPIRVAPKPTPLPPHIISAGVGRAVLYPPWRGSR